MEQTLCIAVHLHNSYYHAPDWPPTPARIFQALVAAAAIGKAITDSNKEALSWLECLPPPIIASPKNYRGGLVKSYVPNNDLDQCIGNQEKINKIRSVKISHPYIVDINCPFFYGWEFEQNITNRRMAEIICSIAINIFQFGRGIDMAWANCEIMQTDEFKENLQKHQGNVFYPGIRNSDLNLPCPTQSTFSSLQSKFEKTLSRFKNETKNKKIHILFKQPPKAIFQQISYNAPVSHLSFDLRDTSKQNAPFSSWPQQKITELAGLVRDKLAEKLITALPKEATIINRLVIGKEAKDSDKDLRLRIVPLPSIGHEHTEGAIRRIAIAVPPNFPLRNDDLEWALSGLIITQDINTTDGEIYSEIRLISSDNRNMLTHYGIATQNPFYRWHTITPCVLPLPIKAVKAECSTGSERIAKEAHYVNAVKQALRHAGIQQAPAYIRVQTEPFIASGLKSSQFVTNTRFHPQQLRHVEIVFHEALHGPLVIGNGRYLGLGLLAPIQEPHEIFAFTITDGLQASATALELTHALRRAVMSKVKTQSRNTELDAFFTGHQPDGTALQDGKHRHLAYAADMENKRLFIIPPHHFEHRKKETKESSHLKILSDALQQFSQLYAGKAGKLELKPLLLIPDSDIYFANSTTWESVTDYRVTRHEKHCTPTAALIADVQRECSRRGIPTPEVEVLTAVQGPHGGITGRLKLNFKTVQPGPLLLGKNAHFGGGLFKGIHH